MVKRRKVDRRMVVISLDAVGARDLAYLKTLPNCVHRAGIVTMWKVSIHPLRIRRIRRS